MRFISRLIISAAILWTLLGEAASSQDSAVHLATYIEVMPKAVARGAALLRSYRAASGTQSGNLRLDVLHEIARSNRFAILEIWKDTAALDAHEGDKATVDFRDQLGSIQSAPYDERVTRMIYHGPERDAGRTGRLEVLTHVDVMPPRLDDCLALLRTMSVDIRRDQGVVAYEVLQQEGHPNHFTVIEEWESRNALDEHVMAAHTRAFRESLSPMMGALYDERFYVTLK